MTSHVLVPWDHPAPPPPEGHAWGFVHSDPRGVTLTPLPLPPDQSWPEAPLGHVWHAREWNGQNVYTARPQPWLFGR